MGGKDRMSLFRVPGAATNDRDPDDLLGLIKHPDDDRDCLLRRSVRSIRTLATSPCTTTRDTGIATRCGSDETQSQGRHPRRLSTRLETSQNATPPSTPCSLTPPVSSLGGRGRESSALRRDGSRAHGKRTGTPATLTFCGNNSPGSPDSWIGSGARLEPGRGPGANEHAARQADTEFPRSAVPPDHYDRDMSKAAGCSPPVTSADMLLELSHAPGGRQSGASD